MIRKNLANIVTSMGLIGGIIACILVIYHPSWQTATGLLIFSLITDGLDGKIARKFGSTKAGMYLDDISDFINFGLHPGLWIYVAMEHTTLAVLYILSIIYRLTRFTLQGQNTSPLFSGLPSPAGAIGIFGVILSPLDRNSMIIGILFIICLTVSSLPCFHVIKNKKIQRLLPFMILACMLLPFLFGGGQYGLAIAELVGVGGYICISLISMIPRYVNR